MKALGLFGKAAERLTRDAAGRLRGRYPTWADAMLNEYACLEGEGEGEGERLWWAIGAFRASLTLSVAEVFYPFALAISLIGMTLYQWCADEGLTTLALLSALSVCLGALRPSRFFSSGAAVGAVVAAVNGFETFSGVRPAYEIHHHTMTHDLRWLLLVIPAIAASALGRKIGLKLSS